MTTLSHSTTDQVRAVDVHISEGLLSVSLSDGREINLSIDRIDWLAWLTNATPEQKSRWSIEPGGFAIYWRDLDDGIEISHLLSMQSLA